MNETSERILAVAFVLAVSIGGIPISATADSAPTASLSYSPTTPNPDDNITLDASGSTDANGDIESYAWDTDGDGEYGEYYDDADNGQTARISFDTGGTYTVGLKVTDSEGNIDTITDQITVDNPAPSASFSYSPNTPNPDDTITLDASSSSDSDGRITSYAWDTDGDGEYGEYYDDSDNGQTTRISFDTGGTYTVGVKVTDNGGKSTTITDQITVDNPAPSASFSYSPNTPNPGDKITLDASSSSDPDGRITSYAWDTDGDGEYGEYYDDSDNGETTHVSFSTGGTYTVGLKITDNGGKTTTTTKQVTVDNPAPSASFSYSPNTPNPDDKITLDASSSSDPDGRITSYAWDTDGDGEYGEYYDDSDNGETTHVSFSTGGTYTVGLKITDNGGKTVTTTKQITVENPKPTAEFTYSGSSTDGLTVQLNGAHSSDPDGRITEYDWYIGGEHEASGQTPSLSFYEKGSYTVKLVVTDNGGAEASVTNTVSVSESPIAEFTAPSNPIAVGNDLSLSATSSYDPDGTINSYEWTFADGTTKIGDSVTKQFTEPGQYTIELAVTDDTGNVGTAERTVQVEVPPDVSVSWKPTEPADDQPVAFEASSSSSISEYRWDFDSDGRVEETGQSVEHAFPDGGDKQVTLTAVGPNGLEVDVEKTVSVRDVKPKATFSWSPDIPRSGQDVVLTANSSDEIRSYEWDFDNDGEFDSQGPKVTHSFASKGKQAVVLKVTDEHGDTASYSEVVTLQRSATFEISSERSGVKPGDEVLVQFAASNQLPDEQIRTKLNLNLPESGVSISGVDGGDLASRSSTTFITIEPGEGDNIQLRLQMNDPGNYSITGTAVYYVGDENSGDRRTSEVGAAEITVSEPESSAESPGFGILGPIVAFLIVSLGFRHRL